MRAAASWWHRQRVMRSCVKLKTRWSCRYNDDLARKRADGEHEKQRARQRELVGLQEESARRQEAERRRVAEQIEAERRATEKYKARLGVLACQFCSDGCDMALHRITSHKAFMCRLKASCSYLSSPSTASSGCSVIDLPASSSRSCQRAITGRDKGVWLAALTLHVAGAKAEHNKGRAAQCNRVIIMLPASVVRV